MAEAQTSSFDRISPTALMVAYARQFTNIPYSQEIAQLVDAAAVTRQLLGADLQPPVELALLIEGRYKAIDQLIAQSASTQILELASGLLPRGVATQPQITFIESDLPAMIQRKQQLVSQLVANQLVGDRPNLHFAAIDVTSQPSQFPLYAPYLRLDQPITIVCEGLLMYLSFAQKRLVFANVREMLERFGGVWITSDLLNLKTLMQRRQVSPALQQISQIIDRITDRSNVDHYFRDADQMEQFVIEQGFRLETHPMLPTLPRLSCLQPLGIDKTTAAALLTYAATFTLTLA